MQAQQYSMTNVQSLYEEAVQLLEQLITIPSFSKEEDKTAGCIQSFLQQHGIVAQRHLNNVYAVSKYFDVAKPTLLLNSHHDTVKPNAGYTKDPFKPQIEEDKLFGLGSNDAGGCVVSLIATFVHFYDEQHLKYNLVLAITAEEEISGRNGIEALLPLLPKIDCAVVGEPTLLQMAVAERGLLVIDATTTGKAGHAARQEGENALYKAAADIQLLQQNLFDKVSPLMGPVQTTVTVIETENKTHNIVPDNCKYVIDVRINECYTHEEVLQTLSEKLSATLTPRSLRMRSTNITLSHPLVQSGTAMGLSYYGSPTTSDKALIPAPALKLGPGNSARSHTADEYIYLHEVAAGIQTYIQLINGLQ